MTELEVAEALREDDLWLQRYPTSDSYITALLYELGLEGATISTLFELYANEIDPEDVIRLWHIYNDRSGQMIEPTDTVDYTKPILMALNTLRNESDVLVLYWENRLGVPNDTLPSDGVPIKESENSNSTLDDILDDVYYLSSGWTETR